MSIDRSVDRHLYRIFAESFAVRDIAGAIVSFDSTADALEVQQHMLKSRFRIVGIREGGVVTGYALTERLDEGACGDFIQRIAEEGVLEEWDSITSVIQRLADCDHLFVKSLGRINGIVTRTDLQKPPVRMWLFGMITIIEMSFNRMIAERFPDETWQEYVSEGRMEKARWLLDERIRRNQDLDLLDCLQFSDKGQIVVKDEQLRTRIEIPSKRQGEKTIRDLEALRNSLAHSQDIIACDWDVILRLASNVEKILSL